MNYWPWWTSGIALSFVMLFHWFSLHRMMAVSGRLSSLIDRVRHGKVEPAAALSEEEMLAAIQEVTAAEFTDLGEVASELVLAPRASVPPAEAWRTGRNETTVIPPARTTAEHVLFLFGLVLGGAVAAGLGSWHGEFALRSEQFSKLSGESDLLSSSLLILGGLCVGFGTRMAGGCTSGHGLCGTSRLQPGSLLATASFFGAGIATSFALGFLL